MAHKCRYEDFNMTDIVNLAKTHHLSLGIIYNPFGAWLHDKVNSRRGMFMTGFIGIVVTTSCVAAFSAEYSDTTSRAGNGLAIFFLFLYLTFQGYVGRLGYNYEFVCPAKLIFFF